MPKSKPYTASIPRIYKRQYEDIGLFFWVESVRSAVPACTIEQGLTGFFNYVGIDDWNLESAMTTYIRLKAEFYESAKTHQ